MVKLTMSPFWSSNDKKVDPTLSTTSFTTRVLYSCSELYYGHGNRPWQSMARGSMDLLVGLRNNWILQTRATNHLDSKMRLRPNGDMHWKVGGLQLSLTGMPAARKLRFIGHVMKKSDGQQQEQPKDMDWAANAKIASRYPATFSVPTDVF